MLEEQGRVLAIDAEGVRVAVSSGTACQSCQSRALCGQGALNEGLPQKTCELRLPEAMSLHVGDRVVIGVQEQPALKSALVMYLLPVLFSLLGAGLADAWSLHHDGWTALGTLCGLLIGLYGLHRYERRHRHDENYQARILSVIRPQSTHLINPETASTQDGE